MYLENLLSLSNMEKWIRGYPWEALNSKSPLKTKSLQLGKKGLRNQKPIIPKSVCYLNHFENAYQLKVLYAE